jgi:hypothetical protein
MNREQATERARAHPGWNDAVQATMQKWNISREEAEEIVTGMYWEASDEAALSFAKAEMPKYQLAIEDGARITADALAVGLLSPIAVDHLREALALYDRERGAKRARYGND